MGDCISDFREFEGPPVHGHNTCLASICISLSHCIALSDLFWQKKCISSFQSQDSLEITKGVTDFTIRIITNDKMENKVECQVHDKPLPILNLEKYLGILIKLELVHQ